MKQVNINGVGTITILEEDVTHQAGTTKHTQLTVDTPNSDGDCYPVQEQGQSLEECLEQFYSNRV